jgi:uncharacterized membrane protein
MFPWHQYLLGLIFIAAGFFHLQKPKVFERILPPYLPSHKSIVLISGILEMILGFMLLSAGTQITAAWGLLIMLFIYLPVHVYMLQDKKASLNIPKSILILRLPLQFALMYWVFQYV